jgi:hypothetical protein
MFWLEYKNTSNPEDQLACDIQPGVKEYRVS